MSNFDERPLAPGIPTNAFKATVAVGGSSAAIPFRTQGTAGGFLIGNFPVYVTLKAVTTTPGVLGYHIAFGDSNVAAPGAGDMVITDADEWVRVLVKNTDTHFRVTSEAGTGPAGSVYAYLS